MTRMHYPSLEGKSRISSRSSNIIEVLKLPAQKSPVQIGPKQASPGWGLGIKTTLYFSTAIRPNGNLISPTFLLPFPFLNKLHVIQMTSFCIYFSNQKIMLINQFSPTPKIIIIKLICIKLLIFLYQ